MNALLRVRGLDVALGRLHKTPILHEVDLSVGRGEIVGLIGETGSGKTTLARAILGLVPAAAGTIAVDGEDITGLRGRRRRAFRRAGGIQYVFQDPLRSLDPDRTIAESVAEPLQIRREPRARIREAVREALELVGLPADLAPRYPGQISGGQRQRVAIARAMIAGPRLLICDEPVSALDAASRVHVLELLERLRAERGVSILLITHDLGTLAGLADAVGVLYRGRLVEHGPAARVLTEPQHPYTRLLLSSVPTIDGTASSAEERRMLRAAVAAEPVLASPSAPSAP
ncbi:ABC transporter ATP-binding protein [Microbacterium sp. RD1]|uniref:ABC transporter ATP-binding protein n=1 Tax=Microbacterium sp. RD1 TaxID=3457313 RepID=UPI003FA60327